MPRNWNRLERESHLEPQEEMALPTLSFGLLLSKIVTG
jgi:hypothetical protein